MFNWVCSAVCFSIFIFTQVSIYSNYILISKVITPRHVLSLFPYMSGDGCVDDYPTIWWIHLFANELIIPNYQDNFHATSLPSLFVGKWLIRLSRALKKMYIHESDLMCYRRGVSRLVSGLISLVMHITPARFVSLGLYGCGIETRTGCLINVVERFVLLWHCVKIGLTDCGTSQNCFRLLVYILRRSRFLCFIILN